MELDGCVITETVVGSVVICEDKCFDAFTDFLQSFEHIGID